MVGRINRRYYSILFVKENQKLPYAMQRIDYHAYLLSPYWQIFRRKHVKYGSVCLLCGRDSELELHHIRYDTLYHERFGWDVVILCRRCHKRAHHIFGFRIPLTWKSLKRRLCFLIAIRALTGLRFLTFLQYMYHEIYT